MTERFTDLDDPDWLRLFTRLSESWFRLETLQHYEVDYEEEEMGQFLRHGTIDPTPGAWQQMIADHVESDRLLRRVHVVVEPLSDYIRYELAAYHRNAAAGEEIGIIPTKAGEWPEELPRNGDFWIFDGSDVWDMVYDHVGRFVAAERVADSVQLESRRQWRDRALALAMPLSDYTRLAA